MFNYNGEEPKKDLERAISEEYGFEVPVLLRKYDELSDTINNNPFIGDSEFDPGHLYVTFLEDEPDWKKKEELAEFESGSDKFFFKGKEVYVYCPGGYGKTKINNNFFEKKLQTTATTRNWRTIKTLLNMCA